MRNSLKILLALLIVHVIVLIIFITLGMMLHASFITGMIVIVLFLIVDIMTRPKPRKLFTLKDFLESCDDDVYVHIHGNNHLIYGSDNAKNFLEKLPKKILNAKVIYDGVDNDIVIDYKIPIL